MILSGDAIQVSCDPQWAYRYAHYIIGEPWPPGEEAIASNPEWAYLYALYVIGNTWQSGEAAIAKDFQWAYEYAQRFKLTYDEQNKRFIE